MKKLHKPRKSHFMFALLALSAIIILGFFLDINAGYTKISLQEFADLFTGEASRKVYLTVVHFRLPRVIVVFLVGIGLSLSGTVLQGIAKNELADPGVLGINAGAGLTVALFITIFASSLASASFAIPLVAFFGALVAALVVYALSYIKGEGISPNRLILTGIALTAAINAVTIMLLLRMDKQTYGFIASWLSGNVWGTTWDNIYIMAPVIAILSYITYYKARTLDVLTLGNQPATGLGVNVNKQSLLLLVFAVGLSGVCVAVGGGISFVGLICPHLGRRLVGPKHSVLIPVSALVGGALMLIADIIGRTIIAPNEISVGIVATIIGAPYFIYLLVSKKTGI